MGSKEGRCKETPLEGEPEQSFSVEPNRNRRVCPKPFLSTTHGSARAHHKGHGGLRFLRCLQNGLDHSSLVRVRFSDFSRVLGF